MPAPKDYVKIQYPRKCNYCDYISNNPSMFHYHKRTHDPIPAEQLCDHGCGNAATVRGTGGVYSCLANAHLCPAYLKEHSIRIEAQWVGDDERKKKTRETLLSQVCGNPDVIAKQKATLKKKFGNFTPEQMKDFRHYARRVRARAQRWAKEQGYDIGPQTFHVDHKLSVFDAWKAGLSEGIVNHPINLQILPAKENCSKGYKSIMTVEELVNLLNENNISI